MVPAIKQDTTKNMTNLEGFMTRYLKVLAVITLLVLLSLFSCGSDEGDDGANYVVDSPTGLSITELDQALEVTWSPVEGTTYRVYYGTQSRLYNGLGSPFSTSTNTYTITNLGNGIKYYVTVTAVDNGGVESAYSTEVSGTPTEGGTDPDPDPAALEVDAPDNLVFSCVSGGSNPSAQNITLKNTGEESLSFSISDTLATANALITPSSGTITGSNQTSVSISANNCSSLSEDTYSGLIIVNAGSIAGSPETIGIVVQVTTSSTPPQISVSPNSFPSIVCEEGGSVSPAPTLNINKNGGTETLTWSVTENMTRLSLSPTSGTNSGVVTLNVNCSTAGVQSGAITVTSNDPDTADQSIDVPVSITVNEPAPVAPSAPSNLQLSVISPFEITLNWTDNSSDPQELVFRIERSDNGGSSYSQIASVGQDVTAYPDSGLSPSTTYYYRVRAYNNGGNSAYSNIASATTQDNAPGNIYPIHDGYISWDDYFTDYHISSTYSLLKVENFDWWDGEIWTTDKAWSFLKFDLSGISNFTTARLHMSQVEGGVAADSNDCPRLYRIDDYGTLDAGDRYPSGEQSIGYLPCVGDVSIDVTAYVLPGQIAAFFIEASWSGEDGPNFSYASNDNGDFNLRPYLSFE